MVKATTTTTTTTNTPYNKNNDTTDNNITCAHPLCAALGGLGEDFVNSHPACSQAQGLRLN